MFRIKAEDSRTKARSGILYTAHGKVKTPFFMPVATKACVKHVSQKELEDMGVQAIISNAFVLYLNPGAETIRDFGGLHKFMKWPKTIFTDSGGFQMLSPSQLISINDKKVDFRDPLSGTHHSLSPEQVMEIEMNIGSDVAMCLDHVPHVNKNRIEVGEAVRRTHLWAERCKKKHDELLKQGFGTNRKQLLFGIAQGGVFKDLRIKSAKQINSLDFDGVAMGGLCIGETRKAMFNAIDYQIPLFDKSKPRYLMGVGSPEDLLEAVEHGCDCFDSRFPTKTGRHGTLFTSKGKIYIDKGKWKNVKEPLDDECDCFVCRNFSAGYVSHLVRQNEGLGMRYVSIHNLHFLQNLVRNMQKAIEKGYFRDFKRDFIREYSKGEDIRKKKFKQVYHGK